MRDVNPAHLDGSHPVRQILNNAAESGMVPTKAQLSALRRDDVPDDVNLDRFRIRLARAADDIVRVRGDHNADYVNGQDGRRLRDQYISEFALQMNANERAVSGDGLPVESLTDISARMFR